MEEQRKNYFIYFAAFSIYIIIFATGPCYTWTSPFLPKFASNDSSVNPISRPLTTTESGLLVSISNVGLLTGPLIATLATGILGKKKAILLSATPLLAAHIMCSFATTIEVFLIARFLMGQTSGATWSVIPGYLGEICEPINRGFFGGLITVTFTAGILFCYVAGAFLSMRWFSIVNLIPVIVFFITVFFFIPESPYDLVFKSNFKKAEDCLITLRKRRDVHAELAQIKKALEANNKSTGKFCDLFKSVSNLRALIIGSGVMAINAMSGAIAVLGYTETIFNLAGSSMPSAYSAIIVGVVGFFSSIVHSKLVDKLGRKVLIISSCVLLFLSLSALGIFFYMQQNNYKVNSLDWLPVCSLVIYMFGMFFGLASVPYILLGELFPSHIKTMAISLCTFLNFSLIFILTFSFPYLIESLGTAYTFWFFAIFMALGIMFCIMLVPETKGKSLQEINDMLSKNG